MVAFVALCRTEPSVLRAAAMGLVALAALGSGARRAGLRNLAVAMLGLLLLDPFLSRSVGFVLSVLASAGIIWWARSWSAVMSRGCRVVVAEAVAVPLAAHLATLPVVAAISGQVSLAGLLANALAGPFVGPATVLGLRRRRSVPGQSARGGGLRLRRGLVRPGDHLGGALRSPLPGSSWPWPTTPAALAWLAAAALLLALACAGCWPDPGSRSLLAAAMVVGLLGPPGAAGLAAARLAAGRLRRRPG